jgi:hypothetical protein
LCLLSGSHLHSHGWIVAPSYRLMSWNRLQFSGPKNWNRFPLFLQGPSAPTNWEFVLCDQTSRVISTGSTVQMTTLAMYTTYQSDLTKVIHKKSVC